MANTGISYTFQLGYIPVLSFSLAMAQSADTCSTKPYVIIKYMDLCMCVIV
jgi:hypothetical protein